MRKSYGLYGERVVMPLDALRALLSRQRRQTRTIENLRDRLAAREVLLTRALHELAVYRRESNPQDFISTQSRHRHPRARPEGGSPSTS